MEQLKQKIRLSHEAGRMPSTSKNGNFTLKLGEKKYSILVLNGRATKAGRIYEEVTGQALPSKYAADAKVERRGRTDYITLANGKEAKLRTFDPIRNKYTLTPIGRSYYSQRKKEYVVSIPVIIEGVRLNGSRYTIRGHMPTSSLGLDKVMANEALSEEQRINKIKTTVLKQFSENRTENGRTVVYEVSDEIYYYDRDGNWQISTLSTDEGGDVSAVLNRPLRKIEKAPLVPQPFDLLPEALIFADDAYCCTRQLAPQEAPRGPR